MSTFSESDSSKELKGEDAYLYKGELLMMRRLLNNQPSTQHDTERDNIFYTRCKIF